MQLSDEHIAQLKEILNEWDRAESDIKRAEQVCNNVVIPSIKELRYAGRRIVDVLLKLDAGAQNDVIVKLLADATFDCHRARHDAIDAATSKIAIDLEVMTTKLGYAVILQVFPPFPKLFSELREIREKIAISRGKRESREEIYSSIESVDFPKLVASYEELRSSESIMIAMAKRQRKSDVIAIIGTIFGIVGLFVAFIFWRYPIAP